MDHLLGKLRRNVERREIDLRCVLNHNFIRFSGESAKKCFLASNLAQLKGGKLTRKLDSILKKCSEVLVWKWLQSPDKPNKARMDLKYLNKTIILKEWRNFWISKDFVLQVDRF